MCPWCERAAERAEETKRNEEDRLKESTSMSVHKHKHTHLHLHVPYACISTIRHGDPIFQLGVRPYAFTRASMFMCARVCACVFGHIAIAKSIEKILTEFSWGSYGGRNVLM